MLEVKLPPIVTTMKQPAPEDEELFKRAAQAAVANKELPKGAPPPATEAQRIKALHQLNARGSDHETNERLNFIVELLRTTFMVEVAVLSLIDVDQVVFKAKAGIDLEGTDRQCAFGTWALCTEHAAMVVVEDALLDARFHNHALVQGPPHLRFYAGSPLVASDGAVYGMLYIADRKPRHFAAEQLSILSNFAELCTRKIEAPRIPELQQKAAEGRTLVRDLNAMHEAVALCNLETEHWEMRWANHDFADLAGIQQESAPGRDVWSLFKVVGDETEAMAEANAAIYCKQPFAMTVRLVAGGDGDGATLDLRFRPTARGLPSSHIPAVGIPAFVESELAGAPHDPLAAGFEHLFWVQVAPAGSLAMDTMAGAASAAANRRSLVAGGAALVDAAEGAGPSFTLKTSAGQSESGARTVSLNVPLRLGSREALFQQVKLGTLLGSGAFGRVYRGFWRGTEVAVKVMDYYCPLLNDDIGASHSITAEKHSALLEALLGREFMRHPNLVQTFDLGLRPVDPVDPDDLPTGPVRHTVWVVCEYFNRGTLGDAAIKGRFRLAPSDPNSKPNLVTILLTAQEIAGGMSLLHDTGILHSDLSANNVLLKAAANSRRFTSAVSDFGLSRICADESGKCTQTVGTVTHQPPELLMEGLLTASADVYAFGVLLWTMYCGEHPFSGVLPCAVIHKVTTAPSCPLQLPEDAPPGVQELYRRCVNFDRAQRPTFHEILAMLAPLVEKAEAEAPPPSPRGSPSRAAADAHQAFARSPSSRLADPV